MSLMGLVIAIGVIFALVILYVISIYNRLVAAKAGFENAFSQISVQLTRRYDLIPNIVEVAKGYMRHESETLTNVIAARNNAAAMLKAVSDNPANPAAVEALNDAEKSLSRSVGGLNLQVEAYPELKANTVMVQLNEELSTTENRVAFARQAFNDSATAYNIKRNSFPANIVASFFGHGSDAALLSFDNEEEIKKAPKVSF